MAVLWIVWLERDRTYEVDFHLKYKLLEKVYFWHLYGLLIFSGIYGIDYQKQIG